MAGSITLALKTAQSGLLTTQQAFVDLARDVADLNAGADASEDAVANNVANVNTAGYSRKIINQADRKRLKSILDDFLDLVAMPARPRMSIPAPPRRASTRSSAAMTRPKKRRSAGA